LLQFAAAAVVLVMLELLCQVSQSKDVGLLDLPYCNKRSVFLLPLWLYQPYCSCRYSC